MTRLTIPQFDPRLDLMLERIVDAPRERVWTAWTNPEHVMKWFTPAPWTTVECEIDLRPGGIFRTVMRGPDGEKFTKIGCYLEIVENEKLVWTDSLGPDYRPSTNPSCGGIFMTAVITLEPHGRGTKYTALALHGDEGDCKKHAEMGFYDGWGTALDQLVALVTA